MDRSELEKMEGERAELTNKYAGTILVELDKSGLGPGGITSVAEEVLVRTLNTNTNHDIKCGALGMLFHRLITGEEPDTLKHMESRCSICEAVGDLADRIRQKNTHSELWRN